MNSKHLLNMWDISQVKNPTGCEDTTLDTDLSVTLGSEMMTRSATHQLMEVTKLTWCSIDI